jgi:chemotaxis protein CheD
LSGSRIIQVLGGQCVAAAEGDLMFTTILGSCVSACLYDHRNGICGMNHFLLPQAGYLQPRSREKFGDTSMASLLRDMLSLVASQAHITARLYGGKRTFLTGTDIGAANGQLALDFLQDNNIAVTDTDLGGDVTRWVRFYRSTGRAFIKTSRPVMFRPAHMLRLEA